MHYLGVRTIGVDEDDCRIRELETDLGLSRDQKPAWRNFSAQLRVCTAILRASAEPEVSVDLRPDVVRDLKSEIIHLKVRLEIAVSLRPAMERLYAVLSPRQRTRADRLLRAHCGVCAIMGRSARGDRWEGEQPRVHSQRERSAWRIAA